MFVCGKNLDVVLIQSFSHRVLALHLARSIHFQWLFYRPHCIASRFCYVLSVLLSQSNRIGCGYGFQQECF